MRKAKQVGLWIMIFFFGVYLSAQENKEENAVVFKKNGVLVKVENGSLYIDGKLISSDICKEKDTEWVIDEMGRKRLRGFHPSLIPFLGVETRAALTGLTVISVISNSAAQKAGLEKGDIITHIDDKRVKTPLDLQLAIRARKPNETIVVTVSRKGKALKINARLGSMDQQSSGNNYKKYNPIRSSPFNEFFEALGIQDTDSKTRTKLGLSVEDTENKEGVLVTQVQQGSIAQRSGFQKDDILWQFDEKRITEVQQLVDLWNQLQQQGSSSKVIVLRKGKKEALKLSIPKHKERASF